MLFVRESLEPSIGYFGPPKGPCILCLVQSCLPHMECGTLRHRCTCLRPASEKVLRSASQVDRYQVDAHLVIQMRALCSWRGENTRDRSELALRLKQSGNKNATNFYQRLACAMQIFSAASNTALRFVVLIVPQLTSP